MTKIVGVILYKEWHESMLYETIDNVVQTIRNAQIHILKISECSISHRWNSIGIQYDPQPMNTKCYYNPNPNP